ncbi:hypothetical protein FACS1894189_5020 [Planctomycetales bacterium]|nr:hypothetical protein FACS1894189_5020 [Planctomycetales bacterium]
MDCESDLFEIVLALQTPCCFSGGLHRWQKKGNENANDGDDDKKFDKGKTLFSL